MVTQDVKISSCMDAPIMQIQMHSSKNDFSLCKKTIDFEAYSQKEVNILAMTIVHLLFRNQENPLQE
jgi:hypothetical protein